MVGELVWSRLPERVASYLPLAFGGRSERRHGWRNVRWSGASRLRGNSRRHNILLPLIWRVAE